MSGYKEKGKDLFKNGWHPEKPGTSLKGQIKGLVGRGDNNDKGNHVARPLAALKDPASFGPPPRRQIATPPPLPVETTTEHSYQEPEAPKSPPRPYQVDTTGLNTSHLPPPPVRRDGSNVLPPPAQTAPRSGAPPSLPPRLPPRSNGEGSPRPLIPARTSTPETQRPSSSGTGLLNQGAINRLGASGISVPGLGIGGSTSGRPSPPPPPRPSSSSSQSQSQMSELQSRFSRLGRSDSTSQSQPPNNPIPATTTAPSTGTTWTQKQQALKTASSFRNDPSSVSLSDAKSAASTFNNFRQRHGDQVAAGVKTANGLHEKYGTPTTTTTGDNQSSSSISGLSSVAGSLVKKKAPPPPPPPKKRGLVVSGAGGDSAAPPPVPLATRPTF
ncbi:hypothetical protein V8F06_000901 [Rhypophila decipiens]